MFLLQGDGHFPAPHAIKDGMMMTWLIRSPALLLTGAAMAASAAELPKEPQLLSRPTDLHGSIRELGIQR